MAKKVRYTVDITEELNDDIEEIAEAEGITKGEVFRRAFGLLKLTRREIARGEHVGVGRDGADSLKKEFVLT